MIKQGDTAPRLWSDLTDGAGEAVDVTGATVVLHLHGLTVENDQDLDASIDEDKTNRVYYDWAPGDTDETGYYGGEWQVTFPNSQVVTFPSQGWFLVLVAEQLA